MAVDASWPFAYCPGKAGKIIMQFLNMSKIVALVLALFVVHCQETREPAQEPDPAEPLPPSVSDVPEQVARGEVIYVPVYSSIFYQDVRRTIDLAATLSIHNSDLDRAIKVTRVDYFNLKGQLIRQFLKAPVTLRPMETRNFVIEERDRTGGTGANFVVTWVSEHADVTSPIVESIMINTASGQGISFTSRGKVIRTLGAQPGDR